MTIEIADRLTALRRERGMSQEELAEKLHVSRQAVSKWERAEASPDTDNLIALAELYQISLDSLLRPAEQQPEAQQPEPRPSVGDEIDPDNPLPHGSFFDHIAMAKRAAFPYPVLVAFVYLALGCCFGLWHPGWIIFLTIPLYYLAPSDRSLPRLLGNPVLVTIIYLLLGFQCGLWHPGWLIFFAIPLFNAATNRQG